MQAFGRDRGMLRVSVHLLGMVFVGQKRVVSTIGLLVRSSISDYCFRFLFGLTLLYQSIFWWLKGFRFSCIIFEAVCSFL